MRGAAVVDGRHLPSLDLVYCSARQNGTSVGPTRRSTEESTPPRPGRARLFFPVHRPSPSIVDVIDVHPSPSRFRTGSVVNRRCPSSSSNVIRSRGRGARPSVRRPARLHAPCTASSRFGTQYYISSFWDINPSRPSAPCAAAAILSSLSPQQRSFSPPDNFLRRKSRPPLGPVRRGGRRRRT